MRVKASDFLNLHHYFHGHVCLSIHLAYGGVQCGCVTKFFFCLNCLGIIPPKIPNLGVLNSALLIIWHIIQKPLKALAFSLACPKITLFTKQRLWIEQNARKKRMLKLWEVILRMLRSYKSSNDQTISVQRLWLWILPLSLDRSGLNKFWNDLVIQGWPRPPS